MYLISRREGTRARGGMGNSKSSDAELRGSLDSSISLVEDFLERLDNLGFMGCACAPSASRVFFSVSLLYRIIFA